MREHVYSQNYYNSCIPYIPVAGVLLEKFIKGLLRAPAPLMNDKL